MAERIWDAFLTERDKELQELTGYGANGGYGKRPVLMVIDINYNFTGDQREPIIESVKRWRNSCGEEAWEGMVVVNKLMDAARAKGIPIIHTNMAQRADNWDIGGWKWKNWRAGEQARTRDSNIHGNEFNHEVAPDPTDIVVYKLKASGFHGTAMNGHLTLLGADSIIMTGTTTSGCVRATVLDAFSENYRVAVVEDGCFDRSQAAHAINLFDMHQKYADVVGSEEVLEYFDTLEPGLFELPTGVAAE